MWIINRTLSEQNPESEQLTADLRTSAMHILVTATTITSGLLVLLFATIQAGEISLEALPIGSMITLGYLLTRHLISRNLQLAQIIWLLMYALNIAVAFLVFKSTAILYLLALIPMAAVTTLGGFAAILSFAGLLVFLMGAHYAFFPDLIPLSSIGIIAFGSVLSGLMGYSSIYPLISTVESSIFSYREATKKLDEARNQRLELKLVQDDLLHANRELTRLTNNLKNMTLKAEEARRVKQEFVANVSHELRTPLNMIIGYTNLIMNSPSAYGKRIPARLMADIASVQRNSQHLVELINDVLDLSQVDAGKMALMRSWISLKEIIESAITAVKPLFESKGLYLKANLPKEDMLVFVDGTRIREVILNLLSNAGRFTEAGGVVIDVGIDADQFIFSVQDTGPGISEEALKRIFEPFHQIDPLQHRAGGSGLGLVISKQFVEMHQGKMWLESEVGIGTTFHISIPIEPEINIEDSSAGRAGSRWINPYLDYNPRQRPSKPINPEYIPRIVVVESETMVYKLAARYLDGFETIYYPTMQEAIHSLGNAPAQMIVVNTHDPEEIAEALRSEYCPIPIIHCWIPGRDETTRNLGVIRNMVKPVEHEDLLAELDKLGKENLQILLVDDDAELSQLFARIFSISRPSYRVVRASNGNEALTLMRDRKPDITLLDLVLPGLSGFDILQIKKKDPEIRDIPVIIISSADPSGLPIVTNRFGIQQSGGFTIKEFFECLQAIRQSLNP